MAFTRLEQAVLDALSWDLSTTAPDLSGQIREARPTGRLNSGSGFLTEILVSTDRPWPNETTSDDVGTVHCLIDGLRDAVAFQARLRHGRLVALVADAYGQDTRRIDWTTVRFEQVFTLGMRGESILFDPGLSRTGQHRRAGDTRPQTRPQNRPQPKPQAQAQTRTPAQAQSQVQPRPIHRPAAVPPTVVTTSGVSADIPDDEPGKEQLTTNAVGVWAVCIVGAIFLSWITDLPIVLTVIGGVMLARQLTKPDTLRSIARSTAKAGSYRVSPEGKSLGEIVQRRD